jgi:hypothetical protein
LKQPPSEYSITFSPLAAMFSIFALCQPVTEPVHWNSCWSVPLKYSVSSSSQPEV